MPELPIEKAGIPASKEAKTPLEWNAEITRIVTEVAARAQNRKIEGAPLLDVTHPHGDAQDTFDALPLNEQDALIDQLQAEAAENPQLRDRMKTSLKEMMGLLVRQRVDLIETALSWLDQRYGGTKGKFSQEQLIRLGYRIHLYNQLNDEQGAPGDVVRKIIGAPQLKKEEGGSGSPPPVETAGTK